MRRTLVPFFNELEEVHNFLQSYHDDNSFSKESEGLSVYEDEKNIYVEAPVPGIKPENIHVTFEKGVLWIKGEEKQEEEKKEIKYHMKSSSFFSYRLPLPSRIDENATPEATCEDGILKITFAKSKESSPQKIQVKKK